MITGYVKWGTGKPVRSTSELKLSLNKIMCVGWDIGRLTHFQLLILNEEVVSAIGLIKNNTSKKETGDGS